MLRNILTIGLWTMGSRLLGFLRDVLIASALGAGPVADAFFVALRLPNLFRRLFGEGAFNAAFVPLFTQKLRNEGEAAAREAAQSVLAVMVPWLYGLALLGTLFMPLLMAALAPGFGRDPAKFALAVSLSRLTFPYLPLICLAALLSGVLNGLGRFAAAAATPILFNLALIAALLAPLPPFLPTRGHALALGVSLSGMAQLVLLGFALARRGFSLRLPWPRIDETVREVGRRLIPGLIGAGVTQINVALDTVIASLLPAGSVSLLYYADRVNQLPLGTIGAAVGTALLPRLSGETAGGSALIDRAVRFALLLALPGALGLMVLAQPIMVVLFRHGALDEAEALRSAGALALYAVGLPAFVLAKTLQPGFFARGDTATPVRIGIAVVALNLVLNLALIRAIGLYGPPLATTLAAMVNVLWLAALLIRRGLWTPERRLWADLGRIALASLFMAALLLGLVRLWPAPLPFPAAALRLAALIGMGAAVYGGLALMLGLSGLVPERLRQRLLRRA